MLVTSVLCNTSSHEAVVRAGGEEYLITEADLNDICIAEGDYLTEEQLELLSARADRLACIKAAFSALSYSDMSSGKLVSKLSRRFGKELSQEVADLLSERGYINDAELAKRYASDYYNFRRWGPSRIRSELYSRRFRSEDISEALSEIETADHTENIEHLITAKYDAALLSDPDIRRRAAAYVYRCGYDSSDIYEVIARICQE